MSNPSNTMYSRANGRLASVVRLDGTGSNLPSTGADRAAGDVVAEPLERGDGGAASDASERGKLVDRRQAAAAVAVGHGGSAGGREPARRVRQSTPKRTRR